MGWGRGVRAAVAAGLLWIAGAVAAVAQSGEESAEARGVSRLTTAAHLADWGRERDDPGALIMAARMVGDVPMRAQGDAAPFFTADALLDEALAMADGDPAYAAAIEIVRQDPKRGVVSSPYGLGPIATMKTMSARENYAFEAQARPNEILRVAAIGDGDAPLDLSVIDASGRVLCRSGVVDHYPVCTVRPRAGRVRIRVSNGGEIWTRVQILSN